MKESTIKLVRVTGSDGTRVEYPWDASSWYLLRDDCPHIDILTVGNYAQTKGNGSLQLLKGEPAPDGANWQRWNLEADLAYHRRVGEITLPLKVPKNCALRCYVIPTLLLSYRDILAMVDDIQSELKIAAVWDTVTQRSERAWSRHGDGQAHLTPAEFLHLVQGELRAALSVRRDPFSELGPHSRRGLPLPENALISHWAARRLFQLQQSADVVDAERAKIEARASRQNPGGRQSRIEDEVSHLSTLKSQFSDLQRNLARISDDVELMTVVYPSPALQRDYRLRQLLGAFAPRFSEALSPVESARSHFPPMFLNDLWELWGAVWLVKEFRRLGFQSVSSKGAMAGAASWSWRLRRDEIIIELDYEAHPTLVDYDQLPPAHERDIPVLEWAARNQPFDEERPFIGTEPKCSPDYILRITTTQGKSLVVGDASLASPRHHGKGGDGRGTKPHTVEQYRRTLGWVSENQLVRCHPMGGFVVYPPPASSWTDFQRLPGASDCTILCPSPLGDPQASRRLDNLLAVVAPEALRSQTLS